MAEKSDEDSQKIAAFCRSAGRWDR
jgi:hypothetical protein